MRRFPDGFLWGVAGAGHQTEGDNTTSDTWFAENVRPSVFVEPSGKACNGYALWREDVDLAAGMGLTAYRFSVEWARVEPVEDEFSAGALAHYEAIVDRCLERGMAPVVTFNHFTSPHWFAMRGGWLDPGAPALFARYCDRVMAAFGDRIAIAVTLNEPDLPRMLTWAHLPEFVRDLERATLVAAGGAAGVPRYRLSNVVVPEDMDAIGDGMAAGHRAARAAIKAHRPDLPVGSRSRWSTTRWSAATPRSATASVPRSTSGGSSWRGRTTSSGSRTTNASRTTGQGAVGDTGLFSGVDERSLGEAVRYAHEATGRPVLVTEHGMGTPDDARRAAFVEGSLRRLLDVVDDGLPVWGYIHWTLMDNFEWVFGYEPKLGLHAVDRETFARTPKPSATVYATIVRANGVG